MIPVKRMIKIDIQTLLDKTEKKQKKNITSMFATLHQYLIMNLQMLLFSELTFTLM